MGVFAPLLWLKKVPDCLLSEHGSLICVSCDQLEKKKLSGKFQVNTRDWGVFIQAPPPLQWGEIPSQDLARLCWAEDSTRVRVFLQGLRPGDQRPH